MKLLSPAGNFESLQMAVAFGADEVYLGVNQFNARNNIDGFTIENLGKAVDFCHINNVKVSLAINILFSDDELLHALNVVISAFNLGVDSFIVQDLALAKLINIRLPKAVLHASTQMGIHNLEGVKAILPYGFKRVVLARETPIDEIKRIKDNVDIEIEYFAHGALCVSFSGNCYLSSYLNDASGNRGKCKQLCRLPYTLYKNQTALKQGYLLSAKDFDLSNFISQLDKAGVDILKIEGRARRPYYVATATYQYKNAILGKPVDHNLLKLAFNRGFTKGYFDGNGKIISNIQNHTGVQIGKVYKVIKGKTFNEVYFTSNQPLNAKSTFKTFKNNQENCVITAYDLVEVKNGYRLTTTSSVSEGETINLIIDYNAEKQTLCTTKKREIGLKIIARKNNPITCQIPELDGLTIQGDVCKQSINAPLSKQDIIDSFNKSDLFLPNLTTELDCDIFLTKKQLNEFRREVYGKVFECITTRHRNNQPLADQTFIDQVKQNLLKTANPLPLQDFCTIHTLSELNKMCNKNVIYSPESYNIADIKSFIKICLDFGKTPILDLPNFATNKDIELLQKILAQTNITCVANNYYALAITQNYIVGGGLNIYNSLSASIHGKSYITAELNGESKLNFAYMTLRHCPYKNHLQADCKNCPHDANYYLQMPNGTKLKITRKKLSSCTFYLV